MTTYTNASLLQYYNMHRGTNKTSLTLPEVVSVGCTVIAVDVMPKSITPLHWNDGFTDISINGVQYISYPGFMDNGFPNITEQKNITNDGITFTLSGIEQDNMVLALDGAYQNAKVNFMLVILNPADNSVLEYQTMYSGYVDYVSASANNQHDSIKNELEININSIWKKLDNDPKTLAANSVHQSMHPGDNFFSLLGILHAEQTWKYKS
ncbi:DUF2163 domain-containing protein [Mangrovibacter plantisponsor]|uniref:DUF2163 domain-containing protein n=1 Tax=Mangrovibacter plantisponsor TaxID=451513 RepID=A0A317PVS0_9ENTR|nr:DUF2163 domain-containing protein [Mangrovibacter plantisponsor]PWW04986.1 hypothetical protein DES37_11482 [Mangrovibacter plantisponsor]